jgi:MFS family permease
VNLFKSLFGDGSEILHDRNLQTLLLANIIPPMGAALVAPILNSLIAPLGTSPADIGLVISFFTAPAIIMIPIGGVISDRYGRKPILIGSLLLFGAAGTAIAFTTAFRAVLGLRLLQGVAFGGLSPIIITSLGDLYEGTEEAMAQGIRFTGSGLTQTVFPLLSGALVALSWWYPFLLYAIAFPMAGVVYLWFEEPTAAAVTTSDVTSDDARSKLRALSHLARQRRVVALVLARALPMVVWFAFVTYNSITVVRILGGTVSQAGVLVAAGSLAYAFVASQAGRVTAHFDSRLYPLIGANGALSAGYVVFQFAPDLVVAGAGVLLSGAGFGLLLSLIRSMITGVTDESLRGSLVSLAEAIGRVVSTVTPIAMGAWIGFASPQMDLASAVQIAGLAAAVVSSGGGVFCLLVANASPPVRQPE